MLGAGSRRDADFQLRLPGFEGSLSALLGLVEHKLVTVADLALAEITAQYAAHIARAEPVDLERAGDFLCAAAHLMLVKSKLLLPDVAAVPERAEHPAATGSPWQRAALQQAAQALVAQNSGESLPSPGRVPSLQRAEARPVGPLKRAWGAMQRRGELHLAPPAFIRLEAALSSLIRYLRTGVRLSLEHLLRSASRPEAAMHFLAVLELVRRGEAVAEQCELFGDITLVQVRSDGAIRTRAV